MSGSSPIIRKAFWARTDPEPFSEENLAEVRQGPVSEPLIEKETAAMPNDLTLALHRIVVVPFPSQYTQLQYGGGSDRHSQESV